MDTVRIPENDEKSRQRFTEFIKTWSSEQSTSYALRRQFAQGGQFAIDASHEIEQKHLIPLWYFGCNRNHGWTSEKIQASWQWCGQSNDEVPFAFIGFQQTPKLLLAPINSNSDTSNVDNPITDSDSDSDNDDSDSDNDDDNDSGNTTSSSVDSYRPKRPRKKAKPAKKKKAKPAKSKSSNSKRSKSKSSQSKFGGDSKGQSQPSAFSSRVLTEPEFVLNFAFQTLDLFGGDGEKQAEFDFKANSMCVAGGAVLKALLPDSNMFSFANYLKQHSRNGTVIANVLQSLRLCEEESKKKPRTNQHVDEKVLARLARLVRYKTNSKKAGVKQSLSMTRKPVKKIPKKKDTIHTLDTLPEFGEKPKEIYFVGDRVKVTGEGVFECLKDLHEYRHPVDTLGEYWKRVPDRKVDDKKQTKTNDDSEIPEFDPEDFDMYVAGDQVNVLGVGVFECIKCLLNGSNNPVNSLGVYWKQLTKHSGTIKPKNVFVVGQVVVIDNISYECIHGYTTDNYSEPSMDMNHWKVVPRETTSLWSKLTTFLSNWKKTTDAIKKINNNKDDLDTLDKAFDDGKTAIALQRNNKTEDVDGDDKKKAGENDDDNDHDEDNDKDADEDKNKPEDEDEDNHKDEDKDNHKNKDKDNDKDEDEDEDEDTRKDNDKDKNRNVGKGSQPKTGSSDKSNRKTDKDDDSTSEDKDDNGDEDDDDDNDDDDDDSKSVDKRDDSDISRDDGNISRDYGNISRDDGNISRDDKRDIDDSHRDSKHTNNDSDHDSARNDKPSTSEFDGETGEYNQNANKQSQRWLKEKFPESLTSNKRSYLNWMNDDEVKPHVIKNIEYFHLAKYRRGKNPDDKRYAKEGEFKWLPQKGGTDAKDVLIRDSSNPNTLYEKNIAALKKTKASSYHSTDIDVFLIASHPLDIEKSVDNVLKGINALFVHLKSRIKPTQNIMIQRTQWSLSFKLPFPYPTIQIILRIYPSIYGVIEGFDLPCCAVAFDSIRPLRQLSLPINNEHRMFLNKEKSRIQYKGKGHINHNNDDNDDDHDMNIDADVPHLPGSSIQTKNTRDNHTRVRGDKSEATLSAPALTTSTLPTSSLHTTVSPNGVPTAWTFTNVVAMERFRYALTHNINIIVSSRASTTLEKRAVKYFLRNFRIGLPNLQPRYHLTSAMCTVGFEQLPGIQKLLRYFVQPTSVPMSWHREFANADYDGSDVVHVRTFAQFFDKYGKYPNRNVPFNLIKNDLWEALSTNEFRAPTGTWNFERKAWDVLDYIASIPKQVNY